MRQAMRVVLFVVAGTAAVMVSDRLVGASHGAGAPTAGVKLCATPVGHVMVARSSGCGVGTTSLAAVAHQQSADDAFTHIAASHSKLADLEVANASLKSRVSKLEADNTSLKSRMSALEATFAGVTRTGSVLTFSGMNLQVVNGAGTTDQPDGTGNLIIGYNKPPSKPPGAGAERGGSHYLVVGDEHEWTRFGGIVAGFRNVAMGDWASVTGGKSNLARGISSSISGGGGNNAMGDLSSISGGGGNRAFGMSSSVSGGLSNAATGSSSSVSGGYDNKASEFTSSVSGGEGNAAAGWYSSVSGGSSNAASGFWSSVSGGLSNAASEASSSVNGGVGVAAAMTTGSPDRRSCQSGRCRRLPAG